MAIEHPWMHADLSALKPSDQGITSIDKLYPRAPVVLPQKVFGPSKPTPVPFQKVPLEPLGILTKSNL